MSVRKQILVLIGDAYAQGARHVNACAVLQLSVRTVQRWRSDAQGDQRTCVQRVSEVLCKRVLV